jgi:hypothetical protein
MLPIPAAGSGICLVADVSGKWANGTSGPPMATTFSPVSRER